MPTLLNRREHGFDVRLYTKDHPPAPVHVFYGEKEAKIGLEPIAILDNWGFNHREQARILALIEDNYAILIGEWDQYHPAR
jgi:hypothetical protein